MDGNNLSHLISEAELLEALRLPAGRAGKQRLRRWLENEPSVKVWKLRNHKLFCLPEVMERLEVRSLEDS
jgi:hypothetical protein